MNRDFLVNRVLEDEGLAGDLDEPEAQVLVGWAVRQAEHVAATAKSEKEALTQVESLCRRARACARLVTTLCQQKDHQAAQTLARQESLPWPLADTSTPQAALTCLLEISVSEPDA